MFAARYVYGKDDENILMLSQRIEPSFDGRRP